jgi:hypothetical protein
MCGFPLQHKEGHFWGPHLTGLSILVHRGNCLVKASGLSGFLPMTESIFCLLVAMVNDKDGFFKEMFVLFVSKFCSRRQAVG